jgi:hypothetical protein
MFLVASGLLDGDTAVIITIGPANFRACLALSTNLKPADDIWAQDRSPPEPAASLTSFPKAFRALMRLEIPSA